MRRVRVAFPMPDVAPMKIAVLGAFDGVMRALEALISVREGLVDMVGLGFGMAWVCDEV